MKTFQKVQSFKLIQKSISIDSTTYSWSTWSWGSSLTDFSHVTFWSDGPEGSRVSLWSRGTVNYDDGLK